MYALILNRDQRCNHRGGWGCRCKAASEKECGGRVGEEGDEPLLAGRG